MFALLAFAVLALSGVPALAERPAFDRAYCGLPAAPLPTAAQDTTQAPITVDADRVDYGSAPGRYRFTGDVRLEQAERWLDAAQLDVYEPRSLAVARQDVRYREPGLRLTAEQAELRLDRVQGELLDVTFEFEQSYAHGDAETVHIRDEERSAFDQMRFTTCPADRVDWWLRASSLDIDREEGMARARHARLDFLGVPVFYSPYLPFPIDGRRRSGFLPPTVGHNDSNGLDLRIPFYWNIAPNYDALLSPRLVSLRGLMLESEWRLLTRRFSGELNLDYLPSDRRYGADRWAAGLEARNTTRTPLSWRLDLKRVSDREYIEDLGSTLGETSSDHLPLRARATYRLGGWRFGADAIGWQTINPNLQPQHAPYRLLPRVSARLTPQRLGSGFEYRLDSELTRFEHPARDLRQTGTRFDVAPALSLPFERPGYFLTPSVMLRYSEYQLDPIDSRDTRVTRTVPAFSLDSGLFLERNVRLGQRDYLQTLEPRLMYLYVNAPDQDEIPRFDTAVAELTLPQLFRANRYTGPDRIGDTNQIAAAVTSRWINRTTGREQLMLSLGQIFYFEERDVVINSALERPERARSDVMGELRTELTPSLTGFADYRWDPYDNETRASSVRLRYGPAERAVINLGYRARWLSGWELELAEVNFAWPLGFRWHAIGGWRHSLIDNEATDRFAGVAFDNCCWTFRLLAREYLRDFDEEPERSIMFQLEFTGLGGVFDAVNEFIAEAVPGYIPRR